MAQENRIHFLQNRRKQRVRRQVRSANKVARKRICFNISNKHMQAQLIDDANMKTLFTVTTSSKSFDTESKCRTNKETAKKIALLFAEKSKPVLKSPDESLVFDRGKHLYHGRVKEFADGLRAAGLKF